MGFVVLLLSIVSLACSQASWVIQNTYRFPQSCTPQNLISVKAWRNGTCVRVSTNSWTSRTCNQTTLVNQIFNDAACTSLNRTTQVLPTNQCGSISASDGSVQGVFFACAALASAPTLSNQNNDVFNEFLYLPDVGGPSCNASNVYQSLSYQSNVCITGENRTCLGSSQYILASPCTASSGPQATGGCVAVPASPASLSASTECVVAVTPTPPPANPSNPPGTSPSTLSACSAATTLSECVGGLNLPSTGFPTLPVTGLINKCCVWCGLSSTQGNCKEPDFSTGLCTCPSNSTPVTTLASIYQCTTASQFGCSCTGRPVGAPSCQSYTGGTTGGDASRMFSLSWGAILIAVIIFLSF